MHLLLIEDDRRLAAGLRRGLQQRGFVVDVAHDGDGGAAAALATPFDVLILDVMLPRMDGFEVTRMLRGRRIQVPILMLTGRDAVDDRVHGLEVGADDYLLKPFALRELVARIHALLRRRLPERSTTLRAGAVELDVAAHEVRLRGQSADVTAKEFAVLEYLMVNQGRALTRSQIIEHVWGSQDEGGFNLVEVYVARLRRKLAAAGVDDPIVTIRGIGYRLDASPR
jgi:two-component system, OmpR family, response regulator